MFSTHLAELYEVEPRALVQAVKRNIERFPPDFMVQLSRAEFKNLKSQIVTSSWGGLSGPSDSFLRRNIWQLHQKVRSLGYDHNLNFLGQLFDHFMLDEQGRQRCR